MTPAAGVPVTADESRARRGRTVLLDIRWALGDPHGRAHHAAGHLPGAVSDDLETELSDPPSPSAGRHPLPSLQRLQAAARRWGIRDGDPVVAYDDTGGGWPRRGPEEGPSAPHHSHARGGTLQRGRQALGRAPRRPVARRRPGRVGPLGWVAGAWGT